MRAMLSDGVAFEIPDDWCRSAGLQDFIPKTAAYRTAPDPNHPEYEVQIVPIALIKPVHRSPDVKLDFGGFAKDRMIDILRGFVSGDSIVPIKVSALDDPQYRYQLYDGMHRFHASVAAGYDAVPVIAGTWGFAALE